MGPGLPMDQSAEEDWGCLQWVIGRVVFLRVKYSMVLTYAVTVALLVGVLIFAVTRQPDRTVAPQKVVITTTSTTTIAPFTPVPLATVSTTRFVIPTTATTATTVPTTALPAT